jgi:hypothetical protein
MKQKSVFFLKIKNIEKRLGNLTIKNREKTQNNKIRNKKREIQQTPQKSIRNHQRIP